MYILIMHAISHSVLMSVHIEYDPEMVCNFRFEV